MDSLSRDVASLGQWTLAATYLVVAAAAWLLGRRRDLPHLRLWAGAASCAGFAHGAARFGETDSGLGVAFVVLVTTLWQTALLFAGARSLQGTAVPARQLAVGLAVGLTIAALTGLTTLPVESAAAALVVQVVQTTVVAAGFATAASLLWRTGASNTMPWAHWLVAATLVGYAALSIAQLAIRTQHLAVPIAATELLVLPEWGLLVIAAFGAFAALPTPPPDRTATADGSPSVHRDWTARMDALRHLSGKVAHDINNALTAVNGNVEWVLQSDKLGEAHRQALEDVAQAAARGSAVTARLRALFEPTPGERVVDDLNSLVRQAADRLRERHPGLRVRTNLGAQTCGVRCVGGLLARAIELLTNRAASVSGGTRIGIETELIDSGRSVALTVTDSGPHMDTAAVQALFDPYFEDAKRPGLTEVWTIVSHSQGSIRVDSEPGDGTRIRIEWPRTDVPVIMPSPNPAAARRPLQGPLRILLAEDDEPVRAHAARALSQAGHEVTATVDGEEAARALERERFDLVITDVRMPRRDGIELASLVRERDPDLPVLLISGYVGAEQAAVLDLPLLHKPFTGAELLSFLESSTAAACST